MKMSELERGSESREPCNTNSQCAEGASIIAYQRVSGSKNVCGSKWCQIGITILVGCITVGCVVDNNKSERFLREKRVWNSRFKLGNLSSTEIDWITGLNYNVRTYHKTCAENREIQ